MLIYRLFSFDLYASGGPSRGGREGGRDVEAIGMIAEE